MHAHAITVYMIIAIYKDNSCRFTYLLPFTLKVPSTAIDRFPTFPIAMKQYSDSVGGSVGIKTVTLSVSVLSLMFLVSFFISHF